MCVARTTPPPGRSTRVHARPPRRRPPAARSSSAAGAASGDRRTHWTSSTLHQSALSYLSAGAGERPSSHPAIKAEGSGRHGRVFRRRTSKDAARSGRGGGLQCERRTRSGSSARSGPLKTTATAARLRLFIKINGNPFHWGDLRNDR